MQLALLGADVLKVEPPGGEGSRGSRPVHSALLAVLLMAIQGSAVQQLAPENVLTSDEPGPLARAVEAQEFLDT